MKSVKAKFSRDEYKKKYKNNDNFFSSEELKYLKISSSSRGAGFIALKGAIKKLVSMTENIEVSEKDIKLSHNKNDASGDAEGEMKK